VFRRRYGPGATAPSGAVFGHFFYVCCFFFFLWGAQLGVWTGVESVCSPLTLRAARAGGCDRTPADRQVIAFQPASELGRLMDGDFAQARWPPGRASSRKCPPPPPNRHPITVIATKARPPPGASPRGDPAVAPNTASAAVQAGHGVASAGVRPEPIAGIAGFPGETTVARDSVWIWALLGKVSAPADDRAARPRVG